MKQSFKEAFRYYKYLILFFTVIYWAWICIDDCQLIEQYNLNIEAVGYWSLWYSIFLIAGSLYFWLGASAGIIIYRMTLLRKRRS
jgi:hypothetical protein